MVLESVGPVTQVERLIGALRDESIHLAAVERQLAIATEALGRIQTGADPHPEAALALSAIHSLQGKRS